MTSMPLFAGKTAENIASTPYKTSAPFSALPDKMRIPAYLLQASELQALPSHVSAMCPSKMQEIEGFSCSRPIQLSPSERTLLGEQTVGARTLFIQRPESSDLLLRKTPLSPHRLSRTYRFCHSSSSCSNNSLHRLPSCKRHFGP